MEKIIIHIRPINWSQGDVYGIKLRLSGCSPTVRIDWGDGTVKTYCGNTIEEPHIYLKDESLSFIITATVMSGSIDCVYPTGGDCSYELLDFSKASSIREIEAQCCQTVILDNPNLEKLSLTINLADSYDLSRCPNLRFLEFQCEYDCECHFLDLSKCHKLESFSNRGYMSPMLRKITIANDAPLKYFDMTGHNLYPSCREAIHRIVERNGGVIVGEFEEEEEEEE